MNNLNNDLDVLYNSAISAIFKKAAMTHVYEGMSFLTQEEFEDNEHSITKITSAYQRLQENLKKE